MSMAMTPGGNWRKSVSSARSFPWDCVVWIKTTLGAPPQRKGVRKIRQDVIRSKRGIEPVPAALQRFGQRWENAQVPRPEKVSVLPRNFPIQQLLANPISPNTLAPVAVSNPVPRG